MTREEMQVYLTLRGWQPLGMSSIVHTVHRVLQIREDGRIGLSHMLVGEIPFFRWENIPISRLTALVKAVEGGVYLQRRGTGTMELGSIEGMKIIVSSRYGKTKGWRGGSGT